MSKIGKRPIAIPEGIEAKLEAGRFLVSGPKGKLEMMISPLINATLEDNKIVFKIDDVGNREKRSMWGTTRALANNLIEGVLKGYEKKLEVVGVGYRVEADKKNLTLTLGYSHPIILVIPEGIEVTITKNVINVSGNSKQIVGEFSALIRSQKLQEPYKGKGIKYSDEIIRRKAGKVMKAAGS